MKKSANTTVAMPERCCDRKVRKASHFGSKQQ